MEQKIIVYLVTPILLGQKYLRVCKGIQNIQNRNQYSTLKGLFINRKKITHDGVAALMQTMTTYPK